jgi:hypothetical protein
MPIEVRAALDRVHQARVLGEEPLNVILQGIVLIL